MTQLINNKNCKLLLWKVGAIYTMSYLCRMWGDMFPASQKWGPRVPKPACIPQISSAWLFTNGQNLLVWFVADLLRNLCDMLQCCSEVVTSEGITKLMAYKWTSGTENPHVITSIKFELHRWSMTQFSATSGSIIIRLEARLRPILDSRWNALWRWSRVQI